MPDTTAKDRDRADGALMISLNQKILPLPFHLFSFIRCD
jgi:hypothetical protein